MNIFLSHVTRGEDREVAEKLRRELEDRGHTVWDAPAEIHAGDSILARIDQAIRAADVIVVLVSKDSTKSPWQITETSIALSNKAKSQKIIPVSIGEDTFFPPLLSSYQGVHIANYDDLRRAADEISSAANSATQAASPSGARSASPEVAVEWARELIELEKERSISSAIERESVIRSIFLVVLIFSTVAALIFTLITGDDAWTSAISSILAAAAGAISAFTFQRRQVSKDREGRKRG